MAGEVGVVEPQDLVLCNVGPKLAAVTEAVRAMTGLDASAVQELVTRVPSSLRARIAPALADALRRKLVALGATVVVRAHVAAAAAPALFDVYLQDHGERKIEVVRALKMMLELGLREAVELADDAPVLIKRRVDGDEAETLRHELVEAGAAVDLRQHDPGAPPGPAPTISESPIATATTTEPLDGFSVILRACGDYKIRVIKVLREATGLGLKDAKEMAESTDVLVKQGLRESEARALERALAAVGARAEVRGEAAQDAPDGSQSAGVDLVLHSCGPQKIAVIKLIREIKAYGLREAKDLAETPGSVLAEGLDHDDAQAFALRLVAVGAAVELRASDGEASPGAPRQVALFLHGYGHHKIAVIKEVRALTGLGLKEAKDLVEAAPCVLHEQVDVETARKIQARLAEVGADVELR